MREERSHGLLVWAVDGKLPDLGVAGSRLDERGAIRRAAKRSAKLIDRE